MAAWAFLPCVEAEAAEFDLSASSRIRGGADESLWGAAILSDGTIAVAGRLGDTLPGDVPAQALGAATNEAGSGLLLLSPDGREVLQHVRLADEIRDLAIDQGDRVYLASPDAGVLAVDLDSPSLAWSSDAYWAHRIDVTAAGSVIALEPDDTGDPDTAGGNGTIHVYEPDGSDAAAFSGYRNTTDVCWAGENIAFLGWRQATAIGNPVQIAYVRLVSQDGSELWTAYDWSTEEGADDYLNRPENNMADTRGYRCTFANGRVYAGFEAAGGNHIFRYAPHDVMEPVALVGGDEFHEFYNTKDEHKTVVTVLDAATGDFVTAQQFLARLDSGAGNTVRLRRGGLSVDEAGRVFLTGASASGFPFNEQLDGVSDYRGGAYFLAMSADFSQRLHATRVTSNGEGHAVAVRTFDGETNTVYVGQHGDEDLFAAVDEVPSGAGGGELDGFFAVWNGVTPALPPEGGSEGGSSGGAGSDSDSGDSTMSGGDGGEATGAAATGVDGGTDDAGADTDDGGGADGDEAGCGCRSSKGGPFTLLLGLIALAARRRRRPSSASLVR
ncbi:MAG: MYXO-CTERM sorting domain-containing protein [Myxococcota bacterium]